MLVVIAAERAKVQTCASAQQALLLFVSWSQCVCWSKAQEVFWRRTDAKACPTHCPNRQLILVESTHFKCGDKLVIRSWQSRLLYLSCNHAEALARFLLVQNPEGRCPSSPALLLSLSGQQVSGRLKDARGYFHGWQRCFQGSGP